MAGKKIRIDVDDKDGVKYKINMEGNLNRDKVLKIFELMDLMNIEAVSYTHLTLPTKRIV